MSSLNDVPSAQDYFIRLKSFESRREEIIRRKAGFMERKAQLEREWLQLESEFKRLGTTEATIHADLIALETQIEQRLQAYEKELSASEAQLEEAEKLTRG